MTDGDALYRAILADPDDDAPRLVYADWLDEHGEPDRAEFVRVQCAWAALAPGDPRQDELWERWTRLLAKNRGRWGAGPGSAARNFGFWRGLPDWFDVTTDGLVEQVAELAAPRAGPVPQPGAGRVPGGVAVVAGAVGGPRAGRNRGVRGPVLPQLSARGWVWHPVPAARAAADAGGGTGHLVGRGGGRPGRDRLAGPARAVVAGARRRPERAAGRLGRPAGPRGSAA